MHILNVYVAFNWKKYSVEMIRTNMCACNI